MGWGIAASFGAGTDANASEHNDHARDDEQATSLETPRRRYLSILLTVALTVAAISGVHRLAGEIDWAAATAAVSSVTTPVILAAIALTAISYLAQTGYDVVGLRFLGKRLAYWKIARASFVSLAFSQTVGFGFVTAGAARCRFYLSEGVSALQCALLTCLSAWAFFLGVAALIGALLIVEPAAARALEQNTPGIGLMLGAAMLAGVAVYLALAASGKARVRIGGRRYQAPGASATLTQLALGAADLVPAALALYLLLPVEARGDFVIFLAAFSVATGLALASNIPAGVGVFEGAMLLALPGMPLGAFFGAVILFRVIYYLLPFAVAAMLFAGAEIARARAARKAAPSADPVSDGIVDIVSRSPRAEAQLALSGDKRFFLSDDGRAFLMYQRRGRSWVALGEPVGPENAWPALMSDFQRAARRERRRAVFYKVGDPGARICEDLGLVLRKLGEEAVVNLETFTLKGSKMSGLRRKISQAERGGAEFQLVQPGDAPGLIDELRFVSDEWLEEKGGREKGFSVGFFDAETLSRQKIGVVRVEGRAVAFANLWQAAENSEVSIDLMRHGADTPPGTMFLLMARLIEHAKAQGYQEFNLCMAPLTGVDKQPDAPIWRGAARLAMRRGSRVYGFEGLRRFKAAFRPDWRPRYLAGPGGVGVARSVVDVARIVSRPPRPVQQAA